MGSKKLAELQGKYDEMRQQLSDYTDYPRKFNEFFSDDGWLAHDSLCFDVLKRAVDEYERNGREEAVRILLDYYGPNQVEERLIFFNHIAELRARRKFIDYALTEYREGRHYSAIPLLLMVIDGAVNDATGKGFHASDVSLDAWDSLTVADGAIYKLKGIFQKGRKKTCMDIIDMPYRHGILHGMDLGYDNLVVTAKCWCFLFVVRDWLVSKKSEVERRKAFQDETRVPSLREIMNQLAQTSRLQRAIDVWRPRSISPSYIDSINSSSLAEEGSPERIVLDCLAFWKQRNYGNMAKLFWTKIADNPKRYARDVRLQFERCTPSRYRLIRIVEKASAISEIDVEIESGDGDGKVSSWRFRMIRENERGEPIPSNMEGGHWQIVWIHEVRDEENIK